MESPVKFFRNGKIYASFQPRKVVESLVTKDDKVLYAGEEKIARSLIESLGGKEINLNGNTILPGFIDSHLHLSWLGKHLYSLNLRNIESIENLQRKLEEFTQATDKKWILGRGWDQERFEDGQWPTRWDLDDVVSERPVFLTRVCGHVAVLNTKAMEITGLLDEESDQVLRNEDDEPIGVITEAMVGRAEESIEETFSFQDYKKFFKEAMAHLAAHGVTTVGFVSCSTKSLAVLQTLDPEDITARIRIYLDPGERTSSSEDMYANLNNLEHLEEIGIRGSFGRGRVKVVGIKVLADGSLGGRTAWLSEPYADEPNTQGFPNISKEKLRTIAEKTDALDLQLAVHGIGDATIEMILEIYENLNSSKHPLHRIEHASELRDDQLARASDLGVAVSIQPRFVISDFWSVKRVGRERAHHLYPFRSMMDEHISLGIGTDAPVEELDPWNSVYAAVTRGKYEDIPLYTLSKDETLSLDAALHYYTKGSAEIMGDTKLGSLEEGNYADLIILEEDPFEVEDTTLERLDVNATYVGGTRVF